MIYKPNWFSDDYVMVSTAPTCGLTKGGRLLIKVDPVTGKRMSEQDPETGATVDAINDRLLEDMEVLSKLSSVPSDRHVLPDTLRFVPSSKVRLNHAVPVYYDHRFDDYFEHALATNAEFSGFESLSLKELQEDGLITVRGGHGSPSQEQRIGDVPYIKVSDLRAGHVNINPTNRIPRAVAETFWRGAASGLKPFDLVCPERTSKNIGDFCVLMPGQEQVVMTKEVIILRPGEKANFDPFYLLWAMTLKIVRDQWKRIVFMQTNREDVGKRYLEISIPIAPSAARASEVSAPFRDYYQKIAIERSKLQEYLLSSKSHHFFVSGGEPEAVELALESS